MKYIFVIVCILFVSCSNIQKTTSVKVTYSDNSIDTLVLNIKRPRLVLINHNGINCIKMKRKYLLTCEVKEFKIIR